MQNLFFYLVQRHHSERKISVNDVGIRKRNVASSNKIELLFLRTNLLVECYEHEVEFFDIRKTGDRFEKKVCDRCFKIQVTERDFQNNRIKKDNIITKRPSCKSCRKLKDGVGIPANVKKKWELQRPSGYSPFTCPICEKTTIAGISKIVLDHNHSNGHVRGWLCESCNTGIGRFDDDPEIVSRAINWLQGQNN